MVPRQIQCLDPDGLTRQIRPCWSPYLPGSVTLLTNAAVSCPIVSLCPSLHLAQCRESSPRFVGHERESNLDIPDLSHSIFEITRNAKERQDTRNGPPPARLRAVWDIGEPGGNPEWRMLWAQRRSGDCVPGRFARRTRSPGCLAVGQFGPCPCRSTGAGSAEVAAAKAARTPRSLRETRGGSCRLDPCEHGEPSYRDSSPRYPDPAPLTGSTGPVDSQRHRVSVFSFVNRRLVLPGGVLAYITDVTTSQLRCQSNREPLTPMAIRIRIDPL